MSDGIESAQAALTIGTEYVSQSGALDCPLEEKVPSNLIEEGLRDPETCYSLTKKKGLSILRKSGELDIDNVTQINYQMENSEARGL